ncbi:hypothetical protein OAM56_05975 [Alphaproteobacteria bacterium]|nr:hypothetical protein [Alphaproteobacteria bacterium]
MIIFLFCFLLAGKVHAGVLTVLTEVIQQFLGNFKTFPKLMDEVPDISSNKIILEKSSDEIILDDISKNFVDDTEDTVINSKARKTANPTDQSKTKIVLPATGGLVYSKQQKEEKKLKEQSKQNISKK